MKRHATGTFEVKMTPRPTGESGSIPGFGQFLLDKKIEGDLEGTSSGIMLSAGTETKGSAGYVALEKVTGKLAGFPGTFTLLHRGIMDRGTAELLITVVPDSGTGELTGLAGTLDIINEGGKHSYNFDYSLTLPE